MERPRSNGEASTPRRIASLSAARTPGASLVFVGGPGKPRGSGFARGGDLRQYQAMGASTPVTPAAAGEQAAVEVLASAFTPASELPLFSRVKRRQRVDGRLAWLIQVQVQQHVERGLSVNQAAEQVAPEFLMSASGVRRVLKRARETPGEPVAESDCRLPGRPPALSDDQYEKAAAAARKYARGNWFAAAKGEVRKLGVTVDDWTLRRYLITRGFKDRPAIGYAPLNAQAR